MKLAIIFLTSIVLATASFSMEPCDEASLEIRSLPAQDFNNLLKKTTWLFDTTSDEHLFISSTWDIMMKVCAEEEFFYQVLKEKWNADFLTSYSELLIKFKLFAYASFDINLLTDVQKKDLTMKIIWELIVRKF
jgi:hypothetical protein